MILKTFEQIVRDNFEHLCTEFHLKIVKITDDQVGMYGKDFAILAYMSPDGLSMDYVNLRTSIAETMDIGGYLLRQGKWITVPAQANRSDYATEAKIGLAAFVKNLEVNGRNLLNGETDWIKKARPLFNALSITGSLQIRNSMPLSK